MLQQSRLVGSPFLSECHRIPKRLLDGSGHLSGHGAQIICFARVPRLLRELRVRRCQGETCLRIQSEMAVRAFGSKVSSMPPYSLGEPVGACWNRWFSPGSSLV